MNRITDFHLQDKHIWAEMFGDSHNPPVIYSLAGDGLLEQLPAIREYMAPALKKGQCRPFLLTGYSPVNWNHDYTPWPAPALSSKSAAFTGGGAMTLDWLRGAWMPEIERRLSPRAELTERYVLGYSLGGLCALWMAHACDAFAGCASCSGSLWYDGWTEYTQTHLIQKGGSRVYLSLGLKEEKARNPRMAAVGDATRSLYAHLQAQATVSESALEWQEGGHFNDVPKRLAKAILWLMKA
ncbi:MAG: alpha/beta hydrolase [Oscillospiraceae bacterium]|jgi:predicted alpha/beta superfamily hydrolase|nr:alpha/beta hydrolase [Oscillospiraceae bacterium]